MRRGTPAAEEFGKILFALRVEKGLSMSKLGELLKVPASTVSQIEKAQRALKEPKLDAWAKALGVNPKHLRFHWESAQQKHPDVPVVRRRAKTIQEKDLITLMSELTATERSRVRGYIEAIIEMREQ